MNAVSMIGTILSWFVTPRVGRRPMYLWGLFAMLWTLLIVGFMGIPSTTSNSIQWASGGVLIINILVYFFTIGPVCFTYMLPNHYIPANVSTDCDQHRARSSLRPAP